MFFGKGAKGEGAQSCGRKKNREDDRRLVAAGCGDDPSKRFERMDGGAKGR